MQGILLSKVYQIYSAEKYQKGYDKTRIKFFPILKQQKTKFFNYHFFRNFFKRKSLSAEKGALSSPNTFLSPKTFIILKGVPQSLSKFISST